MNERVRNKTPYQGEQGHASTLRRFAAEARSGNTLRPDPAGMGQPHPSNDAPVPDGLIALDVRYGALNAFFAEYLQNLRHGFTVVKAAHSVPLGTRFLFRLHAPTLAAPVKILGTVVDLSADGMRVDLEYLSPEERQQLQHDVNGWMKRELGVELAANILAQ